MGSRGFGITQSEEYVEIYRRFMKEYDAGSEVKDISQQILKEYAGIYAEDTYILHSVYFAIARAQWMCGALSPDIDKKVKEFILSGQNIQEFEKFNHDKKAIESRKKSLEKFLECLEQPRRVPRKRHPPVKKRQLPPAAVGDVLAYRWKGKEKVLIILDYVEFGKWKPMLFCCILGKEFEKLPEIDSLLSETVVFWGIYDADSFLPKSQVRIIGKLMVPPQRYKTLFGNTLVYGERADFCKEVNAEHKSLTLKELLFSTNYQEIRKLTHA